MDLESVRAGRGNGVSASEVSGPADRAAVWCFGSPRRAACFYPLFKAWRKILLMVLNRSPL